MRKSRLTLKNTLALFALVPLTVGMIILAVFSVFEMTSNLKETTFEELNLAAQGLKSYYEYDLINDNDLEDGFIGYAPEDYIDVVHDTIGVDLTLFRDNVRFMTSLRNDDGTRNEGTKSSDEVWKTVSSGKDFCSDDVVIGGEDYYVYYMPMYDSDGNVCGMAFAGKSATQIQTAISRIITIVIGISIALEVVFVIIALILAKLIAAPIIEVADKLTVLSKGETDIALNVKSHVNESLILMNSLTVLKESLREIVSKINGGMSNLDERISGTTSNAENVSEQMKQIADSMLGLADSTQTLTENISDINQNAVKMGDVVAETVDTVDKLKESTEAMTEANKNALGYVKNISASSSKSSDAVAEIGESINLTNDAVAKINEIVTIISDIASQTNLLSLNASIEAARAGDAGKGFAVVAEEIGKLANESNSSASEIKNIVAEITGLSSTCVEQANAVTLIINEEQKLLSEALVQFETLNSEILSSVENINAVSDITDKLEEIKDTILGAITDLSAVSEETSATNEEVSATTETVSAAVNEVSDDMSTMSAVSKDLSDTVAFFKVN